MQRLWPYAFVLVLCTSLVRLAAAQEAGIQWQQDLEAAKQLAKQTNRMVLVHFWTPSCGPCLTLDHTVFNQPSVASAIDEKFVPVKLNANENSATAQGFGITRVPTDVILTPDGHVVGKLISPPTPAGYVGEISQIAAAYSAGPGAGFANAAANAPMPSGLNAAYASLQISPTAQPALTQPALAQPAVVPPLESVQSPFTRSAALGATAQGAGASATTPSWGVTTPSGASAPMTNRYAMPADASAGSATTTPGAPVANRYAMPADASASVAATTASAPAASGPAFGAPALSAMPQSQTNPFFGAPAQSTAATQQPVTPQPVSPSFNQPAFAQSPNQSTPQNPSALAAPAFAAPALGAGGGQSSLTMNTDTMLSSQTQAGASQQAAGAITPIAGAPDTRQLPAGSPPLGFDGYCPVSMRTNWKWVPGNSRWGIVHRGRTYWFAGEEEQRQFWTDPDRYSPALSGMDPVMAIDHQQQVPGKREHSIDYDNLFYMFSSEATLAQFTANPERYAVGVRQAMGIPRGRLVR